MFVIWGKRKAINCISAKQISELKIFSATVLLL